MNSDNFENHLSNIDCNKLILKLQFGLEHVTLPFLRERPKDLAFCDLHSLYPFLESGHLHLGQILISG